MLFTTSIKFPNIFNLTNGNTDTDGEYTSINRCLALMLTTAKGELLGDPDYGCTLYERLFNGYTTTEEQSVKDEIVEAIAKYEKRIIVNNTDISIERDSTNDHLYRIHISYVLRNSDLSSSAYIDINKESKQ